MASGKPIVGQISFISFIPQIILISLLLYLFFQLQPVFNIDRSTSISLALLTFYIIFLAVRLFLPYNHRKGMRLFKKGEYEAAIKEYEKSNEFFNKHKWIDKYRYIVLLSSSKMPYTEMSLINIAFCNSQLGNGAKAVEYYNKTLQEFPTSEMAKTALKLIESTKNA